MAQTYKSKRLEIINALKDAGNGLDYEQLRSLYGADTLNQMYTDGDVTFAGEGKEMTVELINEEDE